MFSSLASPCGHRWYVLTGRSLHLSKVQLCHLPAAVSLAVHLPVGYNCSWLPGPCSGFTVGMACWPLACACFREPHPVSITESLAGLPPRYPGLLEGRDPLTHPTHCCGFEKYIAAPQEGGWVTPDLFSATIFESEIFSVLRCSLA